MRGLIKSLAKTLIENPRGSAILCWMLFTEICFGSSTCPITTTSAALGSLSCCETGLLAGAACALAAIKTHAPVTIKKTFDNFIVSPAYSGDEKKYVCGCCARDVPDCAQVIRSEERRVGKEW